ELTRLLFTTFCLTPDFAVRWANWGIILSVGIGNWDFATPKITRTPSLAAWAADQPCAKRCWIRIRLQRLILFLESLAETVTRRLAEFMLLCTKAVNLSCP